MSLAPSLSPIHASLSSSPPSLPPTGSNGYRWEKLYEVKDMGDGTRKLVYKRKSTGLPAETDSGDDPVDAAIRRAGQAKHMVLPHHPPTAHSHPWFPHPPSQTMFVSHRGRLFGDIKRVHMLSGHSKAVTLHKFAQQKFGSSIPRWACEIFGKLCPGCNEAAPRRLVRALPYSVCELAVSVCALTCTVRKLAPPMALIDACAAPVRFRAWPYSVCELAVSVCA